MDKKLILFDNAEKIRREISKLFKDSVIFPSSTSDLELCLKDKNGLLVTEFKSILPCPQEDLLNIINIYSPTTIIHTNSDLYKKYLDQIEKAKISYIIEKSILSIRQLEGIINKLSENLEYKETIIIPKVLEPKKNVYSAIHTRCEVFEKGRRPYGYYKKIPYPTRDS